MGKSLEVIWRCLATTCFVGCMDVGEDEVVRERVWEVGAFRIEEKVVREATMHDPVYDRTYRVQAGGSWAPLGVVRDEGDDGVIGIAESTPPAIVAGHLVVFVGATTFVRAPSGEVVRVSPYDAARFSALRHADRSINGHYDLKARELTLDGRRWEVRLAHRRADVEVVLSSDDAGASWRAALDPRATGSE